MLNDEQKRFLLRLARESIISAHKGVDLDLACPDDEFYQQEMGAFVTLHRKGKLRGCIGMIMGQKPLFDTIRDMARSAALEDPRFSKVRQAEMDEIDIEISILSPLVRTFIMEDIQVGEHGLYIQKGFASGLLLPQVATEYNWDRQQLLQHTCEKAGLHQNAWMNDSAKVFRFTAEVFGENDSEESV